MLKLVELELSAIKLELANSILLVELLEKLETAVADAFKTTFKLFSLWLFTLEVDEFAVKPLVSVLVSDPLRLLFDWDFWTSEAKFNEWTRSTERISSDVWGSGDIDEAEDDDEEEELFVGDEEVEAIDEVPGNGKWVGMFLVLDVE